MLSPSWYSGQPPAWHQLGHFEQVSIVVGLVAFFALVGYEIYKFVTSGKK